MLSISGWMGDIMLKKSENMAWWKGAKVFVDAEEFHVDTLHGVLSPGIYEINCVGDVLAGRVEQGIVKPGEGGNLLAHTHQNFFNVETHHHLDGNSIGEGIERRAQEW